jgi:hypothetical protein
LTDSIIARAENRIRKHINKKNYSAQQRQQRNIRRKRGKAKQRAKSNLCGNKRTQENAIKMVSTISRFEIWCHFFGKFYPEISFYNGITDAV